MNEDTRVNHPSYYEKKVNDNRIHPECIELLEIITRGFPGILALDAGQLKYCYRFGSKDEEGLSKKEKAAEDTQKIVWYIKDFTERFSDYKLEKVEWDSYIETITSLVAEEFAFDKPKSIKPAVRKLIFMVMRSKTNEYDPEGLVLAAEDLAKAVEQSSESEWN